MKLKKISWKRFLPYVCIAGAALIALGVYCNNGYPYGHDLEYHAASVVGMSKHGVAGVFTGKIYGYVSNDLGLGEGLFYPPLAHICAALIYMVIGGFASVFTALKIFYFLALFFSGVFMYKLILLLTNNKRSAIIAGVVYLTTPYFLTDVLVRSAMAETTMFIFMPIVLIGIYYLLHDRYKKFLMYFVIGCVGVVHSHLVLTMYFVLLCIIGFLPYLRSFFLKRRLLYLFIGVLVASLLCLPFLLPMLQAKGGGDYMVFQPNFMAKVENTQGFRVPLDYLLSIDKVLGNVPLYLSFFGSIALIYSIVKYKKVKTEENKMFLNCSIVMTLVCIFCSSTLFSWEHMPYFLLLIQFSWRLLVFVSLGMAILVGVCVPKMEEGSSGGLLYIVILLSCLFSIAQINNYIHVNKFSQDDLPISSAYVMDYVPVGVTEEQIKEHDRGIVADNKATIISDVYSNTPDLFFRVERVEGATEIVLPRYYYVGYSVKEKKKDGVGFEEVNYYNKDGFVAFKITNDAEIMVNYPGTNLQQLSYWVAAITAVSCLSWACVVVWRKRHIC